MNWIKVVQNLQILIEQIDVSVKHLKDAESIDSFELSYNDIICWTETISARLSCICKRLVFTKKQKIESLASYLISDYFARQGFMKSCKKLSNYQNVEDFVDVDEFMEYHEIAAEIANSNVIPGIFQHYKVFLSQGVFSN